MISRLALAALCVLGCLPASAQQAAPALSGAVTAVNANTTGSTADVSAAIGPASNKIAFLCTVDVSELQGSIAGSYSVTVAGLAGGVSFHYLGSNVALSATTISRTFTPCLIAAAPNTAITVTANANANASTVSVNVSGFTQ